MSVSSWSLMFNWCPASLCSTFSNLTNLNHIICQIFQSWNCKKESTKPKIIAIFERVAEILLYKFENFNSHFTLLHCYRENRRTSICGKINFGVDTINVKSVARKLTDTCFSASSNLGLIQISNITAWAAREKIDAWYFIYFVKCVKFIQERLIFQGLNLLCTFSAPALDIHPIMTGDRDTWMSVTTWR